MKIIKHSTITIDEIEVGIHNSVSRTYNTISSVLHGTSFGMLDLGELPPDFHATIPGKTNFSNCVVEGDLQLWDGVTLPIKKYSIVQDGLSYDGVMPIEKLGENVYECCVDYVSRVK